MAGAIPAGHGDGRLGAVHLPRVQPRLFPAAKRVDGGSFSAGHRSLQRRIWGYKEHSGICGESRSGNRKHPLKCNIELSASVY